MAKRNMEELFETMPELPLDFEDECRSYARPIPIFYRRKGKKAEYRVYMPTRNGEIEINRWRELAKAAVEADGKIELFERIMDYIKDYGWLKKIPDREEWALSCMYYGSYMFWEGFEVIWM